MHLFGRNHRRFGSGMALADAVARAKRFIHEAIRTAPGLGKGCGPLNHHAGSA